MAETQSSDEVRTWKSGRGKSGRCMAGAPNVARADTRALSRCDARWCEGARLLVGLAAFVLGRTCSFASRASARHRNLWRRVVRDPFFVAACVLAATGLIAAALWPGPPANGLPRKGEDVPRRWRRFPWPPLPCSGRPAPWAGGPQRPGHLQRSGHVASRHGARSGRRLFHRRLHPGLGIGRRRFRHAGRFSWRCARRSAMQWVPFVAVGVHGGGGQGALAGVLPLLSWWCLRGFGDELSEIVSAVAIRPASTMRPTVPAGADVGFGSRDGNGCPGRFSAPSLSSSCGPAMWS